MQNLPTISPVGPQACLTDGLNPKQSLTLVRTDSIANLQGLEKKVALHMRDQSAKAVVSTVKKTTKKALFWTREENILYMTFLEENKELFIGRSYKRRVAKVYVLISEAVATRTADQCRSHHQKMVKWHGDVTGIIAHIKSLHQAGLLSAASEQQTQQDSQVRVEVRRDQGEDVECGWMQCINWVEWQQERWERRYNEEWLEGIHDI